MIRKDLSFFFFFMLLTITLISCEKQGELRRFYRAQKQISLPQFKNKLKTISPEKKDHLALWHSMLSGNTRNLTRGYKEKYRVLGLSHVFTPSGFHLSALLTPVKFLLPTRLIPYLLLVITLLTFQLPGQDALKRMSLVKLAQVYLGQMDGFRLAMLLTLLMGQLNSSPLSFVFSCFFLGVIFSGLRGISLIIWFFIGQLLINFLYGEHISLLNLFFSPVANFLLTLMTPFLFFLSYPLNELQLEAGLGLIEAFDAFITLCYRIILRMPQFEVHLFTIILLFWSLWRKRYLVIMGVLLFGESLNLENSSPFRSHRYYYLPQGELLKVTDKNQERVQYFSDGICRIRLRMGIWEKRCSPKRAPQKRSIKKLSYL